MISTKIGGGDKFAALESFFDDLPCAPDKSQALRASRMLGMRRLDDYKRPAVHQKSCLDWRRLHVMRSDVGGGLRFRSSIRAMAD